MNASQTIKACLGEQSRYLTKKTYDHIEQLCGELGLRVEVWCRWQVRCHEAKYVYDSMLCSPKVDNAFLDWLGEQYKAASWMIGLELDAFYTDMETCSNPIVRLQTPMHDVSPLVQYLMGCSLDLRESVEYLKEAAIIQLKEAPWYRGELTKLEPYMKELENALD